MRNTKTPLPLALRARKLSLRAMFVPVPILVAIVMLIAFLLFLLRRRSGSDMIDQQRREAERIARSGGSSSPGTSKLTRHDVQHLLEEPEIAAALAAGKKIKAIKLVRARTGLGLKESKELVERR